MPHFRTSAAKNKLRRLHPPPYSSPLKLIKICGSKTPMSLFKVLRRLTGLFFFCQFYPQNRQKKNARTAAVLSAFCGIACVFCVSAKKITHRPSELTKFSMPVPWYEKKKVPPSAGDHQTRARLS